MIALYPYKAQNDDELSFEKDDIISVVGRDEPEWWRGELNGLSGLFPSNYVGKFVTSGECEGTLGDTGGTLSNNIVCFASRKRLIQMPFEEKQR